MKLYHASQKKDLTLLTPQPTKSNNEYIGDFLFATKKFKMALMYLTPPGIPTMMEPDDDPNIVICSTPKTFKSKDKGGAIYSVPAGSFTDTPQSALTDYEMVSTEKVRPLGKIVYDSSLDAMLQEGIKIRFVDDNLFHRLIKSPNQKELISKLPRYLS